MSKQNNFVILSDLHFPFQDEMAVNASLVFIKERQPKTIVLDGDVVDFYDLSRFDKNPSRINCLQLELDMVKEFLTKLREASPKSEIIYIIGNHEDRLRKYIWQHNELSSLEALTLDNLLGLNELGIKLVKNYQLGKYLITHGTVVRKFSGYSAHGEQDLNDCSGISGHTHRLGNYYKTTPTTEYEWFENGCLCQKEAEYMDHYPNWQQGFSYGIIEGDNSQIYSIHLTKDYKVLF